MTEEFTNEPSQANPSGEQPASTAPPAGAVVNAELSLQTAAAPIRILVSSLSDIGCVRTNNEDFLGFDESLGIFVVCDGMGGMASGEVASSRAVAAILRVLFILCRLGSSRQHQAASCHQYGEFGCLGKWPGP